MRVGLVIPAFGRYPVSRVAFAGYRWLTDVLAGRGITVLPVVVADDGNLDLACEYGLGTLDHHNVLGSKINEGMFRVLEQDVDYVCFTGSDNWLHPDLFTLAARFHRHEGVEPVLAGPGAVIVDLASATAMTIRSAIRQGHPPWLIPAGDWRPIDDGADRGMEWQIGRELRDARWSTLEQRPGWRVGLKGPECMTPYRVLRAYRSGNEEPAWPMLDKLYPPELVNAAIECHEQFAAEAVEA